MDRASFNFGRATLPPLRRALFSASRPVTNVTSRHPPNTRAWIGRDGGVAPIGQLCSKGDLCTRFSDTRS
jgi:hypothetical protein